jgi:hypothetical protein
MLEGEDLGTIQTYANDLKERVEKDLGKVR